MRVLTGRAQGKIATVVQVGTDFIGFGQYPSIENGVKVRFAYGAQCYTYDRHDVEFYAMADNSYEEPF